MKVLVVDDERPALDELAYLLGRDPRVSGVVTADSAAEALRVLQEVQIDAVFSDIRMPGLTGLELAKVLSRFSTAPPVVFVTAHEEHAVDAFDLHVVDYLLKPVREDRLAEAIRRLLAREPEPASQDDSIAVELGGVTRFVKRTDVRYAEAQGDYARLHTPGSSPLVRVPLSTLEEQWRDLGFLRIHRSLLVALAHVSEVRMDGGRCTVVVDGEELAVSRRHTKALRDVLVRRAKP